MLAKVSSWLVGSRSSLVVEFVRLWYFVVCSRDIQLIANVDGVLIGSISAYGDSWHAFEVMFRVFS